MRYFIDNFRGLQKQIIDLKNVNFLVGENSTGKSSLIKAIALLSNFSFWLNGELSSEEFELGTFDDILSANSTRDFFSLGLIYDKQESFNIFSYINDEGMPKIYRQALYSNNALLVIYSMPKNITFRFIDKCPYSFFEVNEILDYIDSQKFKKIANTPIKESMIRNMPFYFCFRYLLSENEKIKNVFKDATILDGPSSIPCMYIAPIRAKPQAIYAGTKVSFTAEGSHTPFIIKGAIKKRRKEIEVLREFGRNSGLFDDVETPGFGKKDVSPFELVIRKGKNRYRISSVGYGVSQILPIIVDILFSDIPILLIQQPEVHLHPKAQAAFGEFLYNICKKNSKRKFIIETHSDYIIDRFRYCQSREETKISSQVFFTYNDSMHNLIKVIPIGNDGKYKEDNIADYRSFFVDEAIKMMEI